MKKQKGTTLIGVLIGITILSVALAAQIRLLGNTIRRETDLRNVIIASNLAREGIEIAFSWRVIYGWNKLAQDYKDKNLCTDIRFKLEDGDCTNLDTNALRPVDYVSSSEQKYPDFITYLYKNPNSLFDTPPFSRTIRIESCGNDPHQDEQCLILKSKVGWDKDKQIEITKKIYNWYVP